jgi:hypothetical protein
LKDEWTFVALVAGAVLLITTVPYVYGYLSTPSDTRFMGIMLDVPDTAQYLSWMRESEHHVLITNRLTPEPNAAVFFNLLWFVLGRTCALTGLSTTTVYQGFRVVAGVFFLAVAYWFCSLALESKRQRITAFLLITLGSGLGWTLVIQKQLTGQLSHPLDIYVAEPNSFLSILAYPHLILSAALMLLVFSFYALAQERRQTKLAIYAALAALVLGLEHAYDLIVVYVVLGALAGLLGFRDGLRWRPVRDLGIVTSMSSPPALYFLYITQTTPVWHEVLNQYGNAGVFTPDPLHLAILLGLPFLLALLTVPGFRRIKGLGERELLVRSWFFCGFFLIYLPVGFQIKMLTGWQVPIGILATTALFRHAKPVGEWLAAFGSRWRVARSVTQRCKSGQLVIVALVVAALPTNAYLVAWRFVDLQRHSYPYYLSTDEVRAIQWLQDNSGPDDVVLSSLTIGQYLPALSGNRAFLAHWAQTLAFYKKQDMVSAFFARDTPDETRLKIITEYNVRYVYYGKDEGTVWTNGPCAAPFLEEVFSSRSASICRVKEAA